MTNREAIAAIESAKAEVEWEYPIEYAAAFDKAIEALRQPEIIYCEDCKHGEACSYDPHLREAHVYCTHVGQYRRADGYCDEAERREECI